MKLKILIGSMSGTAECVAQAIQMDCDDLVPSIELLPMDGLGLEVFEPQALYLICTSTYGSGDVPDNAQQLLAAFDLQPTYLGHVRYGVIALGDSCYPQTFCFGGRRFDEKLQDLGARRIGQVWCHDASGDTVAEEEAPAWCRTWLAEALAQVAA